MRVYLDWAVFKTQLLKKEKLRYQDRDKFYALFYQDEGGVFESSILKDGNPDQLDFETNFQSKSNKSVVSTVIQSLSEVSTTISPRSLFYTGTMGATTTHDKVLDKTLFIKGGILYPHKATYGDTLSVMVIDKDDILGLSADPNWPKTPDNFPILRNYVPEWGVMLNHLNQLEDVNVGQTPSPGVYLRLIYNSDPSATEDPQGVINLYSWVLE